MFPIMLQSRPEVDRREPSARDIVRPGERPVYATDRSTLRTARLLLRPLEPADAGAFIGAVLSARTDLDTFCPLHRTGEPDRPMFERQLSLAAAAVVTAKAVRLVIVAPEDPGRILGAVNLNDISRGLEARATANWWLIPSARGRGIAFEAVKAVLDRAFADLPDGCGLDRVDALIDPANIPSLRLAERLRLRAQPGQHERILIAGESRVHQHYTAFASVPAMASSMIELKPLPGLDAVLRGGLRYR
jgi:RimJ/RimL family protein N-acetyltransferase